MANFTKATGIVDWLDQRLAVKKVEKVMMSEYWIPKNINFLWAMGALLAMLFTLLLVTGIFLLMYYKPDVNMAFDKSCKSLPTSVFTCALFLSIPYPPL